MLNKNKKEKLFTRRVITLGAIKGSLFLSLIGRLYYLQIVKSEEYQTFSDSNRIKLMLIPPQRGKILDREGKILASNKNFYRAVFDPSSVKDGESVLNVFAKLMKFSPEKTKSLIDKYKKRQSRKQITIYDYLTWDEVARVEVNAPDLPGVAIEVGQIRDFATGEISSHVVGHMGPVSEKEIKLNALLNHPDFKIGRYGIEQSMEPELRGEAGVRRMEVNAHGLLIRELSREESKPGKDITLTVSRHLQEFAGQRLEGLSGSATVIDITNGDILCMVSTPGFVPNEFTYGVSKTYWNKVSNDYRKPLINKAISNQYPPGSTFKMITALAALKEGVDPLGQVFCPGFLDLGRTRFHCWQDRGHGNVNMKEAIMHSCNTYFFTIAKRIGIDPISEMATYFNLGKNTGINLSGEKPGLVPSQNWKKAKYKESWQTGDTLNVGIGQGYILATPLQLCCFSSSLASGTLVHPNLLSDKSGQAAFKKITIPKEHLDLVRDGMRMVTNVPGGTAYGSRIPDERYMMAGKTGTSQVISKKGYKEAVGGMTAEQIERSKNHALFIGYAPVENPRYAVCVVIDHGGGGSKAAAPVAKDILWETQKIFNPHHDVEAPV